MKVVKEGKWNIPWQAEYTCPVCEAVLLVEEIDVKPTYNTMTYQCTCALCGKTIMLPTESIAQRVRETVDKKRDWLRSSSWD